MEDEIIKEIYGGKYQLQMKHNINNSVVQLIPSFAITIQRN